jgi:hypothetical protein
MKHVDLDIYRECYQRRHHRQSQSEAEDDQRQTLEDIWGKITNVLEDHGMPQAEHTGLLITEWIRAKWGGLILVERHGDEPKDHSRFDLLREHALAILAEIAPGASCHAAVAAEIVRVVRVDYRGKYIPRIKRLDQLRRDYEIFSKGNTAAQIEQLALQNDISVVRAYQINKEMINRKDKREQPMLPLFAA